MTRGNPHRQSGLDQPSPTTRCQARLVAVGGLLGLLGLLGLTVTACGSNDRNEVVTFTDAHGRVCTIIVNTDGNEDSDVDSSAPDCEYPPQGHTPGPATYAPLPSP
ncbi:hypothetical protein [Parafrankia colletiae]|uniref:hypothetical protein n=1 Tax=Parafrankia colletiae TaxID=573497 RepID=UPI000AF224C6|nr:hypothetical protein [Parafrankia colletiae]